MINRDQNSIATPLKIFFCSRKSICGYDDPKYNGTALSINNVEQLKQVRIEHGAQSDEYKNALRALEQ